MTSPTVVTPETRLTAATRSDSHPFTLPFQRRLTRLRVTCSAPAALPCLLIARRRLFIWLFASAGAGRIVLIWRRLVHNHHPLHSSPETIAALVASGPENYINLPDETAGGNGGLPLHYACTAGQIGAVRTCVTASSKDPPLTRMFRAL